MAEVKRDMFGISQRLKRIDRGYYIVFNCANSVYEVHNRHQGIDTYCLTSPYPTLDYRLLEYVANTQIKDGKIFEELEKNNSEIERRIIKNRQDYINSNLADVYSCANSSTRNLELENSLQTKWL